MKSLPLQHFDGIFSYKSFILAYVVIAFSNNVLMCPTPFLRGTGVFPPEMALFISKKGCMFFCVPGGPSVIRRCPEMTNWANWQFLREPR